MEDNTANTDSNNASEGGEQRPVSVGGATPLAVESKRLDPVSRRRSWRLRWKDGINVVLTLLLVAVGFGQLRIYQKQTHIQAAQLADNRATQRAFINVPGVRIERVTQPGKDGNPQLFWSFTPELSNDGNTPTNEISYLAGYHGYAEGGFTGQSMGTLVEVQRTDGCTPNPSPFPEDPDNLDAAKAPHVSLFIGPHSARKDMTEVVVADETLSKTLKNGWRPYIFGEVRYRDAFDSTVEHVTKYCYWLSGEPGADGFKARTPLCAYWNCADGGCERDKARYEKDLARDKEKNPSRVPCQNKKFILQYDP
jgi:hypothetical protein